MQMSQPLLKTELIYVWMFAFVYRRAECISVPFLWFSLYLIIGNPFLSISSQSRVTEEEIALLDLTKWGGNHRIPKCVRLEGWVIWSSLFAQSHPWAHGTGSLNIFSDETPQPLWAVCSSVQSPAQSCLGGASSASVSARCLLSYCSAPLRRALVPFS